MEKHVLGKVLWVASVLTALWSNLALAFDDPPVLNPTQPFANQTVSVSITAGYSSTDGTCDGFVESFNGYPKLTVNGDSIHLIAPSYHTTDPSWCFGLGIQTYTIGSFAQGAYVVQIDRYFNDIITGDTIQPVATLPLVVAAAPQLDPAPSLTAFGATLLATMVIFLALLCIHNEVKKKNV